MDTVIDRAVQKVLEGDRGAYREVIAAAEAKVRMVVAAMLPDGDSVDDVAQEVFITAYSKLEEYESGTDFFAWMKAIARNVALNERKRWLRSRDFKHRYRAHIERSLAGERDGVAANIKGELLAALRECIGKLKGVSRSIIEAYYFNTDTSKEIARKSSRSEGWARLALHRARLAIARCLGEKGMLEND